MKAFFRTNCILIIFVLIGACTTQFVSEEASDFFNVIDTEISETNLIFNKLYTELLNSAQNEADSYNRIQDMESILALKDTLFHKVEKSLYKLDTLDEFNEYIPIKASAINYLIIMNSTMKDNLEVLLGYFERGIDESKIDTVIILNKKIALSAINSTKDLQKQYRRFTRKYKISFEIS